MNKKIKYKINNQNKVKVYGSKEQNKLKKF